MHLDWNFRMKLDAKGSPCDRRPSKDKDLKDKPVPSEPPLDTKLDAEDETAEIVIPIP